MKKKEDSWALATKLTTIALAIGALGFSAGATAAVEKKPTADMYYQNAAIISGAGGTKLIVGAVSPNTTMKYYRDDGSYREFGPVALAGNGNDIYSLNLGTAYQYRQIDDNFYVPLPSVNGSPMGLFKDKDGKWYSGLMNQYINEYGTPNIIKNKWASVAGNYEQVLNDAKDFVGGKFVVTNSGDLYRLELASSSSGRITLSRVSVKVIAYGFSDGVFYYTDFAGDIWSIGANNVPKAISNIGSNNAEDVVKNIIVIGDISYVAKAGKVYRLKSSGIDSEPSKVVASTWEDNTLPGNKNTINNIKGLVMAWPDGTVVPAATAYSKKLKPAADFAHHNLNNMVSESRDRYYSQVDIYASGLNDGNIAYSLYVNNGVLRKGVVKARADSTATLVGAVYGNPSNSGFHVTKEGVNLIDKPIGALQIHWSDGLISYVLFQDDGRDDISHVLVDGEPLITKPMAPIQPFDSDKSIKFKKLFDNSGEGRRMYNDFYRLTYDRSAFGFDSYDIGGDIRVFRTESTASLGGVYMPASLPPNVIAVSPDVSIDETYDVSLISGRNIGPTNKVDSMTLAKASGNESMVGYGRVAGLDENGAPYFKGILSNYSGYESMFTHTSKININFKEETASNVLATKGRFGDKIVVTWDGSTEKYLVQPQLCNKALSSCSNLGAEISVTGKTFEHTSAMENGVPADVRSTADKRISYKVTPIKEDIVAASMISQVPGKIRGAESVSNGGYMSSPPTLTSAALVVDSNTNSADLNPTTVDDDESNEFIYQILTAPANGTAFVDTDGKIKYTVGNYSGADTFTYRVTDPQGGSVDGTASITVNCPPPEIIAFNKPTLLKPYQNNVFTIKYMANQCNGETLTYTMTVDDPDSTDDAKYTRTGTLPSNGSQGNSVVSFADPEPGNYKLNLNIASTSAIHQDTSAKVDVSVKAMSAPALVLSSTSPTEDDLISLTASFSGNDCKIYGTEQEAKDYRGCYVQWNHDMYGMAQSTVASGAVLSGYGDRGGPYEVTAKFFKANSAGDLQLVGTASESVFVLPGTPSKFSRPVFNGQVRRHLDLIDYTFTQESGNPCLMTTSAIAAEAAASAGKRACLFEFELPEGLQAAADGTPRIIGRVKGETAVIKYKVSKFYVGKPKEQIASEEITLDVVSVAVSGKVTTDRVEYAKGLQVATVTASLTNRDDCTITNSVVDAQKAYTRNGAVCFIEWTNLPAWLTPGATGLTASGHVPAVTGQIPVGYDLYLLDAAGARTSMGTFSGSVNVVDVPAVRFAVTPANGTMTTSDDKPIYLVDARGKIGSYTIGGGKFSTVRTTLKQGTKSPIIKAGINDGDTVELATGTLAGAPWTTQDLNVVLEYEGIADQSQTRTETIKVAQMPPRGLISAIEKPSKPFVTSQTFSLNGRVGISTGATTLSYSALQHGDWKAYLAAQDEYGTSPLTDSVPVDNVTGVATFANLSYGTVLGRNLVMVAEPVLPDGVTYENPVRLISDVTKLPFVSGGVINGEVLADKTKGLAPHIVRFNLQVPSDDVENLGMITWQISSNAGSTWKTMDGAVGKSVSYKFTAGGLYKVRAKIINKNSQAESSSSAIDIDVKQSLKMTLAGADAQLPGRSVTLNLETTTLEGGAVAYDTEWTVQPNNGDAVTHQNINELTLSSEGQTTYDITVRAKPKTMLADDPEAWTTIQKTVKFAWPARVVANISGPKRLEVGSSGKYVASVKFSDTDNIKLKGKWELPVGVTTTDSLDGKEVNLTFAAETFNEGDTPNVTYRTWIDGAQAQTEMANTYATLITEYQFAKFVLNKTAETLAAPAYLRVNVEPESREERAKIGSQKITYAWTVPEGSGITAKASGSSLVVIAENAGQYPMSVVVSDSLGNTQNLEYVLKVVAADPYVAKLALVEGLKFNRAPMSYLLKPTVSGGHPNDHIAKYEVLVDDVVVATGTGNRPPKSLVIPTAGAHAVKLKGTSEMGMAFESSAVAATVKENAPAVCLDLVAGWDRKRTSASITAKCVDGDGRIKAYRWYIDNVLQASRTGSRMSISSSEISGSATIKLEVLDDSGEVTTKTVTVAP